MSVPIRVLILEDLEDDALLLVRELRHQGYAPTYRRVDSAVGMNSALAQETWDIILADFSMPGFDTLQALELLHDVGLDVPYIVVSGTISEVAAVAALRAGAQDFVVKGNFARLGPAIDREVREVNVRRGRKDMEKALGAAETKYRSLIESVPAIVYVVALGEVTQTTYINPQVETILGFTPAEWLADPDIWRKQIHPDDFERVSTEFQRVEVAGQALNIEYRLLTRRGEVRWFRSQTSPVWSEAGQPRYAHGLLIDITDRKQAEAEIERRLAQLAALHSIDVAIASSTELRITLNVFLDQVILQLGVDAANIMQLDDSGQLLTSVAARGFRTSGIDEIQLRIGEGRPGRAAQERRIVVEPGLDTGYAPSHRSSLIAVEAFVSYYGVPLIARGQVIGVLEIFHRTSLRQDSGWLDFLIALAGQAAIAVDNATLFNGLQHSNQELVMAYDDTIEGWSRALDLRDKETEGHSQRVTELTLRLAASTNLLTDDLIHVRRGALLHDIGKMGIPDHILLKPGPLSEEEWVIMRQHPTFAYQLLSPIAYLRPALEIPYCHHERWDGTGYPRGLKGLEIPLAARAFAIVDVWDALNSKRPYRPAWPELQVREHIRSLAGSHFDPDIVDLFLGLDLGPPA